MSSRTARLAEVATIERAVVQPEDIEPGTRYVGLEHVESGGHSLSFACVSNGELSSAKFRFDPRHVLFGKLRPYLVKIVCPDFSGVCSTDILPILPGTALDQRYLAHFLRHPSTVSWATSRATGANLPRLSPTELARLEIPLPPLPEQRRIAAILDKADALRRARKRALALLDGLGQSIFLEMFGDLVHGKQFRRGPIADWVSGFEAGKNLAPDPDARETISYRVLKVSAVTSGTFDPGEAKPLPPSYTPPKSHLVRQGDLLFSRANTAELLGATAYVDRDPAMTVLPDKIWRFCWRAANAPNPFFIQALFSTQSFRHQISKRATGSSGSMKNISQPKVLSLEVAQPPRALQEEYGARLATLRAMQRTAESKSTLSDALFASVQHHAFCSQL